MEECPDIPAKTTKARSCMLAVRDATSQPSRLDIVPVEILAEILYHVTSPKDVLSVARCNKRLCATLLNPSNVMIWRRARSNCIVPGLPPPPPGWSESAYAAFIFDCRKLSCMSHPFLPVLYSFPHSTRSAVPQPSECFSPLSSGSVYAGRSVFYLFRVNS
jgi:hypothetical protein